jgi:hypothetical protein
MCRSVHYRASGSLHGKATQEMNKEKQRQQETDKEMRKRNKEEKR